VSSLFEQLGKEWSTAVVSSMIATGLYALLSTFLYVLKRRYNEQRYRAIIAWWLRLSIVLVFSFLISVSFFKGDLLSSVAGVSVIGLFLSMQKLYVLAKIGIYDVDLRTADGFGYNAALRSARKNIKFLGTGGYKLTAADSFEAAIARCEMGAANRFLLIHPNSSVLKRAAKLAGVQESGYSDKVKQSITKLAQLTKSRGFNIEVRFHNGERDDDLESFRMMFVDDRFCLFSFNAYGKGDGTDFPQLIVQSKSNSDEAKSIYYGFERYFERRWAAAEPWKIEEFLVSGQVNAKV
jgi:hypothetical protein